MTFDEKIRALAALIEKHKREYFARPGWALEYHLDSCEVQVKPGKKYTKVDVGRSGAYMVTAQGEIYGIKAYGVIHRGHYFGTLDTINEYFWGEYRAVKLPARDAA